MKLLVLYAALLSVTWAQLYYPQPVQASVPLTKSPPRTPKPPVKSIVESTTKRSVPIAPVRPIVNDAVYPKQLSEPTMPMPFNFAWTVKDDPSSNDFSHQADSDGTVVSGSYRVLLPDGRTQIVTYRADQNGYVAEVTYQT